MVTTDVIKTKPSNGYNLFNEEQQALHDAYVKTGDSEFLWKLQDLCNKPKLQDFIRVKGNKQSFPDTASVLADEATKKAYTADRKARRNKRKRDAEEPTGEVVLVE
jgi:hypothetical protein